MRDYVGIQGTLRILWSVTGLFFTTTSPGKRQACKAAFDGNVVAVVAALAANVNHCGLGGYRRSANDDTRNADEVRDVGGVEIADRNVRCRRVKEELMWGKGNVPLRGIDDSLGALFQGRLELGMWSEGYKGEHIARTDQGDDVGGFSGEFVGQFLVVGDQVGDVNVTVVLLDKHILPELVTDTEST